MGRHRKSQLPLPKYVYLAKGRYIYKPWNDGQFKGEIVFCPGDAPISKVWEAYESITAEKATRRTLKWLFDKYLESPTFKEKAARTQKDYARYAETITATPTKTGNFGESDVDKITAPVIRKYMDRRAAKVQANRELAFIKLVFSWAYERGIVKMNPATGVSRNQEKARELYVTDEMYDLAFNQAESPWYIRPAMEVAYLCRARKAEVLALTRHDALAEGLRIRRTKNIVRWSERLRAAVATCINKERTVSTTILFSDSHGQQILETTFDTSWQRLMQKIQAEFGEENRFHFHDLKAKGVSDDEGDKQKGSGHKSAAMVATYDRKPSSVDSVK